MEVIAKNLETGKDEQICTMYADINGILLLDVMLKGDSLRLGISTLRDTFAHAGLELTVTPTGEKPEAKFKPGDTLIFDPESFNPAFWEHMPEEDKLKYYGPFGYGEEKQVFLTFICEHSPQHGHCVLMRMNDGVILPMCHPSEFRLVTDEEC